MRERALLLCLFDVLTRCTLSVWFSVTEVHDHLRTHWCANVTHINGKFPEGGILYDLDHKCEIGDCDGSISRKTGLFIEHLHLVHDIELIQCLRPHTHGTEGDDPCSFVLPPEFRYSTQAEQEALYPLLERPLPDACLIERRKAVVRRTTSNMVLAKVAKVYAAAGMTPPSVDPTSTATPSTATPSTATAGPSTAAPSDTSNVELAPPADYTVDVFGAEFHLAQPLVGKLRAMSGVDIGYECVRYLEADDWKAAGFTEAEYTTLVRKHEYLLAAIQASRFLSPDYVPPPSDFIELPPLTNLSRLGVSPTLRGKLVTMGFSLDDPKGMAGLSDEAWTLANVTDLERRMVLRAQDALDKASARLVLPATVFH